MEELTGKLTTILSNVILPNLKAVQVSQNEQIAANDRLEESIVELQMQFKTELAFIAAQLTAARSEIAALHLALKTVQAQSKGLTHDMATIVH